VVVNLAGTYSTIRRRFAIAATRTMSTSMQGAPSFFFIGIGRAEHFTLKPLAKFLTSAQSMIVRGEKSTCLRRLTEIETEEKHVFSNHGIFCRPRREPRGNIGQSLGEIALDDSTSAGRVMTNGPHTGPND